MQVQKILSQILETKSEGEIVVFEIPNPDILGSRYSGTEVGGIVYHGWHSWGDLAHLLFCRMLTPHIIDEEWVGVRYQKLAQTNSFHTNVSEDICHRYGQDSIFWNLNKAGESSYVEAFGYALERVGVGERRSILDLGIHKGDEFAFVEEFVGEGRFGAIECVGIDHNIEAIEYARGRLNGGNVTLHCHDIGDLAPLDLPRFDLIITIGTLQSTNLEFKPLFMSLIQNYLNHDGAIIIGFPNCRWVDGEMVYGAKMPNLVHPDISSVINDISFCKKYLQQHKFRVTLWGKEYIFLAATKIGV